MEEGDEVRIHCIHGKVVILVILNAHLWRLVYLMFAALRECIVQYLYIFCYIYVKKISGGFMSCEFGEGVNKKFTIHCTEPLAWLMGRSVLYSLYCRVE